MKSLNREEAGKEWDLFWNSLNKEWFKVEVLQDYSGEDMGDSLKTWINGNKGKSLEILKKQGKDSEWAKISGKSKFKKIRIHLVDKPYSKYLLWEIEHYKIINIPLANEEVYLINKNKIKNYDFPDGDFMIFDDKKVVRNYYSSEGKMYKADFYYEDDNISKFIDLKNIILSHINNNPSSKITPQINK